MPQDARNAIDTGTKPSLAGANPTAQDSQKAMPRQPDLTKVSANFVPRAVAALDRASEITGDSRTDVLNCAVQMYAYLAKMMYDGHLIFVENPSTGTKERVVFF